MRRAGRLIAGASGGLFVIPRAVCPRNLPRHRYARRSAFLVAFGVTALGLLGFLACREHGRPDPNIRMAISHTREEAAGGRGGANAPAVPQRLEVPPEVVKAYSGVRLKWKDSSNGREGILDVPLDKTARIPGSELDVRADMFLPAFTMSAEAITSTGVEPENPAARIAVLENGNEIFAGWIFTRFPDVHPFQHPRFSLLLAGGIRRTAK
jgi:hypothetical protein